MTTQSRILIVEDDPDTAEMLSAYFEAQGYKVSAAAWGRDALNLCQQQVPDLIIQDIRLPDIDGYEVVRQLRQSLRTSTVPIIFLTEKKEREDRIAGLELGAVDYLTKPFDMQELLLRVRNALRRASYASLVSPVTGLPSQEVIESTLEKLMDEAGWAVIYVSIANIEPFSEAYGFVARDDVLRAVSLIITDVADEVGTNDDFVGHVNKANFVVVTREAKAPTMRDALATRLEKAFNYFYPVKDIERGTVTAPMRAEVGIVTPASGPYSAPNAILNAAMDARRTVATSHIA